MRFVNRNHGNFSLMGKMNKFLIFQSFRGNIDQLVGSLSG